MPDKSPHRQHNKKAGKSIKEKRAEKRTKHQTVNDADPVAHMKRT